MVGKKWLYVIGVFFVGSLLALTLSGVLAAGGSGGEAPAEGVLEVERWGVVPERQGQRIAGGVAAVTPWELPEQAWRIGITEDGVYKVSRESLIAAGVPLVAPSAYRLWWRGQEVALEEVGLADGRWDVGDGLVFYGEKFRGSVQEEKYTEENVYWLTVEEGSVGKRMGERAVSGESSGAVGVCWEASRLEQNLVYWARWSTTPGTETTWFWEKVTGSSTKPVTKTYSVTLNPRREAGGNAELVIEVAAGQEVYNVNPDHHVRVVVNGTVVGDAYWDGKRGVVYTTSFPVELLQVGANTVQWVIMNDPGMGAQVIYLDRIEVRYPGVPQVAGELSICERLGSGSGVYTFTGYSEVPGVYDVRVVTEVERLSGYRVSGGSGAWTVVVKEGQAGARYVVGVAAEVTPTAETLAVGELVRPGEGADYVIVVPEAWREAVAPLAAHRAEQGLRVKVVSIEDVYALFNGGIEHPRAVAGFVKYAYETWPGPGVQMVFLVGDGDINPKGYNPAVYGEKQKTWIVPYLQFVDPDQGEVPTDPMYGDVNGDGYAEVAIGRIAAGSGEQVAAYVAKVLAYEARPLEGWQLETLLIADDGGTAPEPFKELLERIQGRYAPPQVLERKVYAEDYCGAVDTQPCPTMTEAITRAWNAGEGLVVYSGHGAVYRWGHEPLLLNQQLRSLTETEELPFLVSLDCWDGYWMFPPKYASYPGQDVRSIGEWVTGVLTDRGAIADFGPAGLSYPSVQEVMLDGMWKGLYREGEFQLGPLVQRGWRAIRGSYLAKTYTLLGDPGLWLPYWERLWIEPGGLTVEAGEVISLGEQARVKGRTRFEQELDTTGRARWQASRGETNAYGEWQVPTVAGSAVLTAQVGNLRASIPVTVVPAAAVTLTVSPNPVTVVVGGSKVLTAWLQDTYGNAWAVAADSWEASLGTIDASGHYTAPLHPGTGWITATHGAFVTRVQVLVGTGDPVALVITPSTLILPVGQQATFAAVATDEYGNPVAFPGLLTWFADEAIGTITQAGVFTARTVPATGQVYAQSGGLSAQAAVTVVPGLPARLLVTPEALTLTVGTTATLQAQVLDAYGNPTLDPVSWSTNVGAIDGQGNFTAPVFPARGQITATAGTIQTVVPVTVLAGPAVSLTVTPASVVLRTRDTLAFTAQVRDPYGNLMEESLSWTATCGTIDGQGVYTAPDRPCRGQVTARLGDLSASAQVEVRAALYLPLTLRNVGGPVRLSRAR